MYRYIINNKYMYVENMWLYIYIYIYTNVPSPPGSRGCEVPASRPLTRETGYGDGVGVGVSEYTWQVSLDASLLHQFSDTAYA